MVKVTELRIGNWIMCKNPNEDNIQPNKVELLDEDGVNAWLAMSLDEIYATDVSGIPLTSDYNFKLNQDNSSCDDTLCVEVTGQAEINIETNSQGCSDLQYFFPYEIKYVHQLQNLYFALTGEELELKF